MSNPLSAIDFHCQNPHSAMNFHYQNSIPKDYHFNARIVRERIAVVRVPCMVRVPCNMPQGGGGQDSL